MRRQEITIKGGHVETMKSQRVGALSVGHGRRGRLELQKVEKFFQQRFSRNFPTATVKCSHGRRGVGGQPFLRVEISYPS